jgi:hypothetical protein
MDVNVLQRQFARIGARAKVRWVEPPAPRDDRPLYGTERFRLRAEQPVRSSVALDIIQDRVGELFEIRISKEPAADVEVVHVESKQRHLLLMSRSETNEKHKFLCGHDERHWFVAAVPETRAVSTVRTAMDALKPIQVVAQQFRQHVRRKNWNRRRNAAFVRQGEWFFVPAPKLVVNPKLVLTKEPLRRGGGKPHLVDFLYRAGGELVYVSNRRPNGLTQSEFAALVSREPEARHWQWTTMQRDPTVYVRGRVRHADHATITLDGWHQVLMNTETQAAAMKHVAFLD